MYNKFSSLFLLVSILLLLTSCSLFQNKQAIVADTVSTDLSEENIDGIVLGTKINDSNFIKKHQIKNDHSNSYHLDHDKYSILTNDYDVITFITGDETTQTEKEVKVGDSINEVINKYGKNYYEYTVQGVQTIGYVDHAYKSKIDFWYVDEKVITIDLSNEAVNPYQ
ncbi:hypothetical protein [Fictibacillus barbaricus]|uniref:Lipoprotein n=1 Tax=Fictibacillus barbaricus TaxID=182136 RepID=A0ABU1TWT4_9BACL|nr:hypothetical protein [Fictibacillus barbaricus]MDR7071652.1 hypothetical protein [Fictibacillus barbaricus]